MLLTLGQMLSYTILWLFLLAIGTGRIVNALTVAASAANAVSEGVEDRGSRTGEDDAERGGQANDCVVTGLRIDHAQPTRCSQC